VCDRDARPASRAVTPNWVLPGAHFYHARSDEPHHDFSSIYPGLHRHRSIGLADLATDECDEMRVCGRQQAREHPVPFCDRARPARYIVTPIGSLPGAHFSQTKEDTK
jgi:hypothetical protein